MSARDRQVGGDHYRSMAIQPLDFILANNLGYCEANVVKYVCRHRSKNGRQNLEKAIHYLQRLIEHAYPDAGGTEVVCTDPAIGQRQKRDSGSETCTCNLPLEIRDHLFDYRED